MYNRWHLLILGLFTALLFTGCAKRDDGTVFTVAAASSMRFVLEEITGRYTAETGREVTLYFGSTGDLVRQIQAGAPIDLFIAADTIHVEKLLTEGLLEADSAAVYAVGRVVLVCNPQSGIFVSTIPELLQPEIDRIAIANPEHAPYGRAAKEALENAGIWDQVQDKIVYAETVNQVLQFVQTGNVSAAIIALALADAPDLEYSLIDNFLHSPLRHMLAVVRNTSHPAAAHEFAAFMAGPEAQQLLQQYGFDMP